MSDRSILFVSARLSHPITAMRVDMLMQQGFDVQIVGFERSGFYGRLPSGEHTLVGRLTDGAYVKRLPALLRSIPRIRSAIRDSDLVYVNGGDIAFAVLCAGLFLDKAVVREVPDIEEVLFAPGLKGRMYRMLDRIIESRCRLMVLTSAQYDAYYRGWLRLDKPSIVVENKVDPALAGKWREQSAPGNAAAKRPGIPLADRPLRLGWFAQIRDQWSLDFVEQLTSRARDRFSVVIAGVIASNIRGFDRFLDRNPAVEYLGPFMHPDDLPRLYSEVDMQLTAYRPEIPNGWSLSCRLNDSCALRTPVVVRAGTADAARVAEHSVGLVLHEADPKHAAAELAGISAADWLGWRASIEKLPAAAYSLTDEAAHIEAALDALLASR